jgi:hypothetical protein
MKGEFFMFLEDVCKEFIYDLDIKNYSPRTIRGLTTVTCLDRNKHI